MGSSQPWLAELELEKNRFQWWQPEPRHFSICCSYTYVSYHQYVSIDIWTVEQFCIVIVYNSLYNMSELTRDMEMSEKHVLYTTPFYTLWYIFDPFYYYSEQRIKISTIHNIKLNVHLQSNIFHCGDRKDVIVLFETEIYLQSGSTSTIVRIHIGMRTIFQQKI